MASNNALDKYFITTPEELAQRDKVCSERSRKYEEASEQLDRVLLDLMTKQRHESAWAVVEAIRKRSSVRLSWFTKKPDGFPKEFEVVGTAEQLQYVPPYDREAGIIVEAKNSGSISMELEPGCSYFFFFDFRAAGLTVENAISHIRTIDLIVSIPLPDPDRLDTAANKKRGRINNIRDDLESFLDITEVFDEMYRRAVSRIKALNLGHEEEEAKIRYFADYAESLKEKLGI